MKCTFTIATDNPDQQGDVLNLAGLVLPRQVLLTKDFEHHYPLDVCEIHNNGNELKAIADVPDFLLDYTPAIGFELLESHKEGDRRVIDKFKLWQVGLTNGPNVDPSIKSIREQCNLTS
jgi:hypothetical protein